MIRIVSYDMQVISCDICSHFKTLETCIVRYILYCMIFSILRMGLQTVSKHLTIRVAYYMMLTGMLAYGLFTYEYM